MKYIALASLLFINSAAVLANSAAVDALLESYRAAGATSTDAARGEQLWKQKNIDRSSGDKRACASCHSSQLTNTGKHVRTGKPIEPLAPSVNSKSLTDRANIEKWFKRNCKWTLGRECDAQEKADLLRFISQQ